MLATISHQRPVVSRPSCSRTAAASTIAHRALLPRRISPLTTRRTFHVRSQANPAVVAAATASTAEHQPTGLLASLADAATRAFPLFVIGAAVLGITQPTSFDFFHASYMSPALGITMLGMGLTLTFDDIRRVLAAPRRIFAGFALQYTIMPALAFALSRLAGLPLDFAVGLCIVGSCPGGTASNVVAYLAGADVPLSVAMTTASTLGAVVATPLLTKLLLGTLVPVNAAALLISTFQVVLVPVLLGAALNQAFPRQVARLAPLSALSAVLLVATICGSVIAQNASAVVNVGPRLLAAIVGLHTGGFLLGYFLSKALGMPEKASRTNSIEVGMQNSALGALLAAQHFPINPLAPVPCAISACTHSVLGSLLAAFWRARPVVSGDDDAVATIKAGSNTAAVAVPELSVEERQQQVRRWIAEWRTRTGASGAPASEWVTAEEVAMFSAEQLAFLERKRKEAAACGSS